MPQLMHRSIVGQGSGYLASDVRSFVVLDTVGGPVVIAVGGPVGGLASVVLGAGGAAQVSGGLTFNGSMTQNLGDSAAVLALGGQQMLVVASSQGEGLLGYAIGAGGGLGPAAAVAVPGMVPSTVLTGSASGHVFIAGTDGTIGAFRVSASGQLRLVDRAGDSEGRYLADPVEIETVRLGGREFLVVLSGSESGVSILEINSATGALTARGALGAQNGLGIQNVPVGFEIAVIGGRAFIVVASMDSQGTGAALTVMELTRDGELRPVDHILDTLETRFGQVQDIVIVQHDGWSYVIVAGGDDGISLFTMLPDGRLVHLHTVENVTGFGLGSISAMSAVVHDGAIEILVASQDQPGLTQFVVPLGAQGDMVQGNGAALAGTPGDDLLVGGSGNNSIHGGAGNDTLSDGRGADTLTGGPGEDVFLLEPDGATDRITDFEPGIDRIDLTLYPMLYSADQIVITPMSWGARLTIRGEHLDIRSASGGPLSVAEIRAALDWETGRVPVVITEEAIGTAAGDRLFGEGEDDVMRGLGGADYLNGMNGNDLLDGGAGDDTLLGGEGADTLQGGDGDDRLQGQGGNDLVEGGNGNDTLLGGGGQDTLFGGDGDDRLEGRNGFDLLDGGAWHDTLLGGANADTLLGGDGNDRLFGEVGHDRLEGGNGNDFLVGGVDHDTLLGGAGDDTLYGGAHRDVLLGGDGNDYLNGQNGFDRLEGGNGNDTLIGEENADTLLGGDGNDWLDGGNGFDLLDGGAGHDTLLGGANADTLRGGAGNDRLEPGRGIDVMTGGPGADEFVFRDGDEINRITDFEPGVDHLVMDGTTQQTFGQLSLQETDDGLLVQWTGGQVLLVGVSPDDFGPGDVMFL